MATYQDNFALLFSGDTKGMTKSIDNLLGLFDNTKDKLKVLQAQMSKAGIEFDKTGDDVLDLANNYQKMQDVIQKSTPASLQSMKILQMEISEMGAKLGALNSSVIGQAEELEQKMANIRATVGDSIDAAGFTQLEKQIRQASINIGQDADLLAEKVTDALSAGASQETVAQQIELAGKAARGTRGDLNTMVDLGNAIRNTYGEAAGGIQNIYDLTSRTYQQGDITGQEIAQGFGFVGGTAKEAGIDIEDLFQSIAIGSKKVRPEQLFTGLNAAISELNTTNSEAEKALKKLGYENLQAALETKSFTEIATELNESGVKMVDIFGRQAARAINAVGGSSEDAKAIMAEFNDVAGATDQIFKDASDTLKFYKDQQAALQGELRQTIGEQIIPLQTQWVQVQNQLLQTLIDMPPAFKQVAGLALGTGSALGKTASFAGETSKNFVAIKEAGGALKALKLKDLFDKGAAGAKAMGMSIQTTVPILLAAVAAFAAIDLALKAWDKRIEASNKLAGTNVNILKQELKVLDAIVERANDKTDAEGNVRAVDLRREEIKQLKALHLIGEDVKDDEISLARLQSLRAARTATLNRFLEEQAKKQADVNKENKEAGEIPPPEPPSPEFLKLLEDFRNTTAKVWSDVNEAERDTQLKSVEDSKEYYNLRRQYLWEDSEALRTALKEQFGNLEGYAELEKALAERTRQQVNAINQAQRDWETEKQQEQYEKQQGMYDRYRESQDAKRQEELDKQREYFQMAEGLAADFGTIFQAQLSGNEDTMKSTMKNVLTTLLNFIENEITLAIIGSTAFSLATGGLSAGQIGKALAVRAAFGAVKASVASFDEGGIPMAAGMAMVHPTDVIVNPTNNNPMMEKLVNRIAEAVGGGQSVQLIVDGEKLGEASIRHISRRNSQLQPGRSVFDYSIQNKG